MRPLFLEGLEDRRLMAFNVLAEMTTGFSPQLMELAPIDADSQLDLVTIESGKVAVRLGNADGSFGDPLVPAVEIVADRAITGDFTNDGVTDLVTSNFSQISLRIGNGDGSFQDPLPLGLPDQWEESAIPAPGLYGQTLNSLVAGDLNDDGKLDLVLGGSTTFPYGIGCGYYSCGYLFTSSGYVNVLLGTGAGSFDYVDADPSDPDPDAYRLGEYQFANSLAIDDLNNDGQRDVLVAKNGGMAALLGNGTGALQSPVHSGSGTGFSSLSLGDLDGDGNLDAVSHIGNSLILQKGQGDGSFVQGTVLDAGQNLQSAVIGDVDGDGNLDLVAGGNTSRPYYWYYGYDPANTKQASVLLGDGQGGFSLPIGSSLGTIPDIYSSLHKLVLADLTSDGLLDLVTVDSQSSEGAIVAANDGNWGAPEELSITDATIVEGDSGSVNAVFTVILTGDPDAPVTVDFVAFDYYDLGDLTAARAGVDYTPQSGTLTFGPGILSQTISVPVLGDALDEHDEQFFVNLSNAAGGQIIDSQGFGTILDDDGPPQVTISDVTKNEGHENTTSFVFTVSLSEASGKWVSVEFTTSDGTATSFGNDYVGNSGTVDIAPGQTSATITIMVPGDEKKEPDETFFVYLTEAINGTISDYQGVGTILNDDSGSSTPAISISDASIVEGNSGTKLLTFTITLSQASSQSVSVKYKTANGTAKTSNNDYVSTSGTITFSPGQTTKTITVKIKGDTKIESDEYFFLNLSGASGAVIADGQGKGTIVSDDFSTIKRSRK